ncbi:hypothetical protein L596_012556 [Steinernema carpocapsae]|nr:hypothetical protein L596_012556 [Steinernema carpocapsae]
MRSVDMLAPVLFNTATITVNSLTLFKIYNLPTTRKGLTASRMPNRSKELRLCYMLLTEVLLITLVAFSLRFGFLFGNVFFAFLATTFMWSITSTLDGITIIIFNTEMHTKRRPKPIHTLSSMDFGRKFNTAIFCY